MIQHICDHIGCKNVVDGEELRYCLEMIGKVYCREHRPEERKIVYKISYNGSKKHNPFTVTEEIP